MIEARRSVGSVEFPTLLHTAIDTTDCRGLAEFYRELFGLHYRAGDEAPTEGPDDADWLVLLEAHDRRAVAIQQVDELTPTTWPAHEVPMQLHLDFSVGGREELEHHRARAEALGARVLLDRTADEDEPLYVLADLAGHPFCLLVR